MKIEIYFSMPIPPHLFDDIVHKALASEVRREILMCLTKKPKYLSEIANEVKKKPQTVDFHLNLLVEIGIVEGHWREGKKYYELKDKRILEFLREHKPIPAELRPKPPHEIIIEVGQNLSKRLDRIEKKLDRLIKERK